MSIMKKIKRYLSQELGVEEEEVEGLIQLARESLRENFEKLEKCLLEDRIEEFARVIHTIKGVLLNLGLEEEAAFSKEIELKARAGEAKEMLTEMVKTLKRYLAEFI